MPESNIVIHSDRLAVEISRPGAAYSGTRFDWTGFVTQVSLDNQHTFCVPEDYQPDQGTGGIGLCNEFGIDQPVGYDSAKPGELFPKFGVGLLTRLDKPDYSFWYPHKIEQLFPTRVDQGNDHVTFVVEPIDCAGYAARITKRLVVSGTSLRIEYALENTGDKPIQTNEYVHNFIGIDQKNFGPDYVLNFPYAPIIESPSEMNAILLTAENRLMQKETPTRPFYARLTGFSKTDQPQWELLHQPSGVAMRESVDFTPNRIAVWGTTHVISVEVFIDLQVQPGETKHWTRTYGFSD